MIDSAISPTDATPWNDEALAGRPPAPHEKASSADRAAGAVSSGTSTLRASAGGTPTVGCGRLPHADRTHTSGFVASGSYLAPDRPRRD